MAPSIEATLLSRKAALLYRNTALSQAVSIANAIMLAYLMGWLFAIPSAPWWLGLAVAGALARMALARGYRRDPQRDARAGLWCQRYVAAAGASGLIWGAGAVLFMWDVEDTPRLFAAFVMAGMVAGAVPILAPVRRAFAIFAWPVIVPVVAVSLLQAGSPLH